MVGKGVDRLVDQTYNYIKGEFKMREIRTPEECIIDKALYLVLLDLVAQKKGSAVIGDRLKCMKLCFLAEYPLFEQRIKAFNLTYFNYDHGPISKHLYEVWKDLEGTGYISFVEQHRIELNDKAHDLTHDFISEVLAKEENKVVYNQLQATSEDYGKLATPSILNMVYDMEVCILDSGERAKIKDAPLGVDFIHILDDEDACSKVVINQSWLETLALELNPNNRQLVARAVRNFNEGCVFSNQEVWGNVS